MASQPPTMGGDGEPVVPLTYSLDDYSLNDIEEVQHVHPFQRAYREAWLR